MQVINIEQKTPEWLEARKGKMTASHAQEIGNNGKGLGTYIIELMAELYSTEPKEQINNANIERGNELEEQARVIYEFEHNCTVQEVGFISFNDYVGCSPDGLIGEYGLIEIKCLGDTNYLKVLIDDSNIDSKYIWQMQMQMLVTGRKWCDFVAYNPNFNKTTFVKRIIPDPEKFEKLMAGFKAGEERIKEIKKIMEAINEQH